MAESKDKEPATDSDESVYTTPTIDGSTTSEPAASTSTGRFQIVQLLGIGGMGKVYKAYDPVLQRNVALKVILWENPELIKRMMQEARAQAKVIHENVCQVYEVDLVDGKPFIAMQLLEGPTLGEAGKKMNLHQKLSVMKDVAEAIHAAHKQGLIHRDIKPSNIIVERTEDGGWKPHVMDFGLAREESGLASATMTGSILGTPHYMSPEQARGETHTLDRRSDVYSLGATLYALLSGKPPFDGTSTVEVLMHVVSEEPVSLRKLDPRIPVDVETIVMKCLEQEPQNRYDSARSVAEDLNRYLEGEPIAASRAGILDRLIKKARKHKLIASITGIAMVTIVLLGIAMIRLKLQTGERERTAQRFGQEVQQIEWIMQRSYLLPLHDTSRDRKEVTNRMKSMQDRIRALKASSQGAGYYALGRGNIALRNYAQARIDLEKARQLGYENPESEYALAEVLLRLYQKEVILANRIENKTIREKRLQDVDREYRLPALSHLANIAGSKEAEAGYLAALEAFLKKDYNLAIEKAQSASRTSPWLYDAELLEGDTYTILAKQNYFSGKLDQSRLFQTKAITVYQQAIRKGESDPAAYESLCGLYTDLVNYDLYHAPKSLQENFDSLIRTCDMALLADPASATAYQEKASAYWQLADYQQGMGVEPTESVNLAVAAADRCLALDPDNELVLVFRGIALDIKAQYELENGLDPRGSVAESVDSFRRALKMNPNSFRARKNLGLTLSVEADYDNIHGIDAEPVFQQSVENLEKARDLNPDYDMTYANLAYVDCLIADYRMSHGKDPLKTLEQSLGSTRRALEINPTFIFSYKNMAHAYSLRARFEWMLGKDPRPSIKKVEEVYRQSLDINPAFEELCLILAGAYLTQARYEMKNGVSPEHTLAEARQIASRALVLNHEDSRAWLSQGETETLTGVWEMNRHRSPSMWFQRAKHSLEKAASLNRQDPDVLLAGAQLCRQEALWLNQQRRPSGDAIQEGLDRIHQALRINPASAEAKAVESTLLQLDGRAAEAQSTLREALLTNSYLSYEYSK